MRRRLSALAAATLLTIGGLLFGTATPVAADPPTVNFTDLCGAVGFSWDTGTIGGADGWPTTVLRNDTVIDEFPMQSRGSMEYGASDGDVFEIRREGLPASAFLHRTPDGCTDAPLLTITPTSGCAGLTLSFANAGTSPISGIQVLATGYAPWEVAPLAPGRTELELPLVNGDGFYIRGPLAGGGWSVWLTGTHVRPADCAAEPSPIPSADPSAEPTTDPTVTPAPGGTVTTPGEIVTPGVGAGGGLPVTGTQPALITTAGLALVGVGVALFIVTRRRRVRFTTTEGQ
jgi:LPXTG-motif cell wall-anchored protein